MRSVDSSSYLSRTPITAERLAPVGERVARAIGIIVVCADVLLLAGAARLFGRKSGADGGGSGIGMPEVDQPPAVDIEAVFAEARQAAASDSSLMGFAYIGHAVWVFEGHPSALESGCRDADVLIVDRAMADVMQQDWIPVAASVMRNQQIYVHDRATLALERVY